MRRSIRSLIPLVALILPLTLTMPAQADRSYAVVFNQKDGVNGGRVTGVTPDLQSNWNETTKSCNSVHKEMWLLFPNSSSGGRQWIEVGVTDGKIEDASGRATCSGLKVSRWTGYFTAYQFCDSSGSTCEYSEFPYGSGSGVGTSHTYELVKASDGWTSRIDGSLVMNFRHSTLVGNQIHIGMEGNGTGALTFGDTTSTSAHQYKDGYTWYDWCDVRHQPTRDCTAHRENTWSAAFGGTSSAPNYTTATYQDH